jgi:urease accessory protein UreE
MAQFKTVTLTDGKEVTINMDEVRTMLRSDATTTTIFFDQHHVIHVKETPNDILIAKAIRKTR